MKTLNRITRSQQTGIQTFDVVGSVKAHLCTTNWPGVYTEIHCLGPALDISAPCSRVETGDLFKSLLAGPGSKLAVKRHEGRELRSESPFSDVSQGAVTSTSVEVVTGNLYVRTCFCNWRARTRTRACLRK